MEVLAVPLISHLGRLTELLELENFQFEMLSGLRRAESEAVGEGGEAGQEQGQAPG